jgi:hypothetical protein
MKHRLARTLIAVAIGASSASAQESDPRAVQPERPTVATHAFTVSRGFLEIETGVERDRFDASSVGYTSPTFFKIGLAGRVQLGLSVPVSRPPGSQTGIGDLAAGLKWRFIDDAPIVGAFALLPVVKFATGSQTKGTGSGTTDASLLAISSHKFGAFALDLNAGYTRRSGNGSTAPRNATQWTVSTGGPFSGAFGWVAECYGYPGTDGAAGQAPIVAVLVGPTLLARAWLAFDTGVIIPVSGPQPRAFYAGLVYNVGRIWASHP